jgi:integrase
MERLKRPYSLHSRPTKRKNRRIFYALFRDENGTYRTSAISTGCTRHDDAVRWCEAKLRKVLDGRTSITLSEYAEGFWMPAASFAVDRAAHGRPVSNGYLDAAESYTRVHVLPAWGTWRLRDFTTRRLDSWVVDLHRCGELAPATINKIVQALRTILERAVVDGWITENPADHVKSVRVRHPERTILSPSEALRLLAGPDPWADFRQYAINALAATTGVRMGEIRALLVENVKTDHVEIRRSWEEGYGPRRPKAESMRDIPIAPRVYGILSRVIQETAPTTLLFYGKDNKDTPLSKSWIEKNLARALQNIGITLAEQRERRISFHGWRHFLNSLMRSNGVSDAKTRRVTGHRSSAMTDWYTSWPAVDISEVVTIQNQLLIPRVDVEGSS